MTFANPAFKIPRQSVVGMEGEWAKMFDPPTESPPTPEFVLPTNPVPEVMFAAGAQSAPSTPHTVMRDLLHGLTISAWDGLKNIIFYTFRDGDNPSLNGNYPAGTIRVPRGVIFHGDTHGHGPPPHTIHWHGIEPTPQNDGVGHCSMELGQYTYQWQPNFIGTYFYHCHRNTMQHFEFGLFGLLLIEPPDAYFASVASTATTPWTLNGIPIGACSDGLRRTAARLESFPQFTTYVPGNLAAADFGINAANPHAFTVGYDVELLWVLDDRDSVWSDLAPDARATFPRFGSVPGVNDEFTLNPGALGFFAFNDYNADYWFITGVPVPAHRGGTGTINVSGAPPAGGGLPGGLIPPALNSGVSGSRISMKISDGSQATAGQTILIRCLDAAYNKIRITFPVDAVIIAWDGRALGVPPFGLYNRAFLLPANTPITTSTARRFDALVKATPNTTPAKAEFLDTRGNTVLATANIPFDIV